jgi:hypothetical protein
LPLQEIRESVSSSEREIHEQGAREENQDRRGRPRHGADALVGDGDTPVNDPKPAWDLWCHSLEDDPRESTVVKTTDGSFAALVPIGDDPVFFDTLEEAQKFCEMLAVLDGLSLYEWVRRWVPWRREWDDHFEELLLRLDQIRLDQRRVTEKNKCE